VRFGDDSIMKIEGSSLVLFICKNGEHRMFGGVYYISRLMTNIVSVGQLDEASYDISIKEGVMNIREPSGRLLVRVERVGNRLYQLTVNVAQPVCLATREEESVWRWHARLGHTNMSALRRMAREELVRGLPPPPLTTWISSATHVSLASRRGVRSQARRSGEQINLWRWFTEACVVRSHQQHQEVILITYYWLMTRAASCG
jgi:hypothetical protein